MLLWRFSSVSSISIRISRDFQLKTENGNQLSSHAEIGKAALQAGGIHGYIPRRDQAVDRQRS